MPELIGLDLCRHLRHDRLTHRIPIVMHMGTDLPRTEAGLYDDLFESLPTWVGYQGPAWYSPKIGGAQLLGR